MNENRPHPVRDVARRRLAALARSPVWFASRWVTWMEGAAPAPRHVPDFYRRLADRSPGSVMLVETPWYDSQWNGLLPVYAAIHHQTVRIGMTTGLCSGGHWGEYPAGAGIAFRAFAHLSHPETLRADGVDYVVFHRDLAGELARVIDPIDLRATGQPDVSACIEHYRRAAWPEVFRDEAIVVLAAPG